MRIVPIGTMVLTNSMPLSGLPESALVADGNGNLYGTPSNGLQYGRGTVF